MSVTELTRAIEAEERLASDLQQFVGQWVAVRDHAVVAHADTLRDVLAAVEPDQVDRIFEVSEESGSNCFF